MQWDLVEYHGARMRLAGSRQDVRRTKVEQMVVRPPAWIEDAVGRKRFDREIGESVSEGVDMVPVDGDCTARSSEVLDHDHRDERVAETATHDESVVRVLICERRGATHAGTVFHFRREPSFGRLVYSGMVLPMAQLLFLTVVSLLATDRAAAEPPVLDDRILYPAEMPRSGRLPYVVDPNLVESIRELAEISRSKAIQAPLRAIARSHLGRTRDPGTRAIGLEAIRRHDGPASLFAMAEVFRREGKDVRDTVVSHLAGQGDIGQAALVAIAVHHEDADWRRRAVGACSRPLEPPALAVLEGAFRHGDGRTIERAAYASGSLDAARMIPHLIVAQYATTGTRGRGDLAWIAIGTQQSYVRNLVPVVGNRAGAFQPVPGLITEGFVLRVTDAVAVSYRTEVHRVLLEMSARRTDLETAGYGWDFNRWRDWFNGTVLPSFRGEVAAAEASERARGFAEAERERRRKAAEAAIAD